MTTLRHMLLLLLGQNVAASGLVGPGAVTTYGGGGGGRSRGYGYVQDPAKGFFITGSTLEGGDFSPPPAKGCFYHKVNAQPVQYHLQDPPLSCNTC